jgi:transketolase
MRIDIRDAFFNEVYKIAQEDKNVVFITADADAFALKEYKENLPNQFINVGCAEQNMVAVASGLALSGKTVFIYAIIPFITLRCYEQIKVNICSMNLPVHIIGVGAGFSFENDGATHHGTVDISVMKTLPELTIFNPSDPCSSMNAARLAYNLNSPSYIRLDKGEFNELNLCEEDIKNGFSVLKEGIDSTIISTGSIVHRCLSVAEKLSQKSINIGVINFYKIKPINFNQIFKYISKYKKIYCVEENCISGSLGTSLIEILNDNNISIHVERIAIPDVQTYLYGSRKWLHEFYKIDEDSIYHRILESC